MEMVATMQFQWARDWNYRQGAVAVEICGGTQWQVLQQ